MSELDKNILVVDDAEVILDGLRRLFFSLGFSNVTFENNVATAWDRLNEQDFDLIISDVQMLPTNGLDFLKKLKSPDSKFKEIPVIMMSTHLGYAEAAICAGASIFVGKNDFSNLKEIIRKTLV